MDTSSLTLRPCALRDLWAVNHIFRQQLDIVPADAREYSLCHVKGITVAQAGNEIVGFLIAWVKIPRVVLWVDYMAVAPRARGLRIGTALLEHCEANARRRGFSAIELAVQPSNLAAIPFYEKQGFRCCKEPEDGSVVLAKKISDGGVGFRAIPIEFEWYSPHRPLHAARILLARMIVKVSDLSYVPVKVAPAPEGFLYGERAVPVPDYFQQR